MGLHGIIPLIMCAHVYAGFFFPWGDESQIHRICEAYTLHTAKLVKQQIQVWCSSLRLVPLDSSLDTQLNAIKCHQTSSSVLHRCAGSQAHCLHAKDFLAPLPQEATK